jgi:hypothetical protein
MTRTSATTEITVVALSLSDRPSDCNALDFDPLVSKVFLHQLGMADGMDMDLNVPLKFSTFDRNILDMQRDDDLGGI